MVYNVNCSKKSQMLKPENLFHLPQDNRPAAPKSTREEYEKFLSKVESVKNKD